MNVQLSLVRAGKFHLATQNKMNVPVSPVRAVPFSYPEQKLHLLLLLTEKYGSAEGPPRGVENRNLLCHPDDLRMEAYVIRMT